MRRYGLGQLVQRHADHVLMRAPLMNKRVLLLPLIGDEKLCDGLSEAQRYALVSSIQFCMLLGDDDIFVDPFSEANRSPLDLCAGLTALVQSFPAVLAGVVLVGGAELTRLHGRIELARGRERHLAEPSLIASFERNLPGQY